MPELPEVEAARKDLEKALGGHVIVRARAQPDPIVYPDVRPATFVRALRGRRVEAVERKGKHLWFVLDRRPWPLFHFGMTGRFHLTRSPQEYRFERLQIEVEGGIRAVFTDPRRFGRIRLQTDPLRERPLSGLGFDPLCGLPSAVDLRERFAGRQAPTKVVLLDQALFAGVGNWIADEVLYQSGLGPHRRASTLSLEEVGRLRRAILFVVRRAVAVDADAGRFPRYWLFHHRWGRQRGALTARGERIVYDTIGGRTTAWVPTRQR